MENLVIDRQRWGKAENGGFLKNEQTGKQCCLGFYCVAKGIKKIVGQGMPSALVGSTKVLTTLKTLLDEDGYDKKITEQLAIVNDAQSVYYTPKRREARIKTLFAKLGVRVKFIN